MQFDKDVVIFMNSYDEAQDMKEGFYRAFEDRFRGTREAIKSRLMVYQPFIEPLKETYDVCNATDLGCGRGEWLELITETGMVAHGVDLDDGMLAACRERGLSVETADAISHLKSLPDESQTIISGFHIIEHIAFSDLQILIQEAVRVLKPAGLLILETPNPENIVVSSTNFHLDPSHIKPIPPQLLAFLVEYYGFYRNKILRLQEPFNPLANKLPNLFQVLYGVSPDYSIIAQKQAAEKLLRKFDTAFDRDYGLSLEKLAGNFDSQIARTLDGMNNRLDNIQVALNNTQVALDNIYASRSWRITAPLRKTADIGRRSLQITRRLFPLRTLPKRAVRKILRIVSIRFIIPLAENRTARAVMGRFPSIKVFLKKLAYGPQPIASGFPTSEQNISISPPAMRIYLDLVNNIRGRGKEIDRK